MPALGWRPAPEVLTMVMILSQSLDKQGADPIACRTFSPELVRTQRPRFSDALLRPDVQEGLWTEQAGLADRVRRA